MKKTWLKRVLGTFLASAMLLQSSAALALESSDYYEGDYANICVTDGSDVPVGKNGRGEITLDEPQEQYVLKAYLTGNATTVKWDVTSSAVKLDVDGDTATLTAMQNTETPAKITVSAADDPTAVWLIDVTVTGQPNGGLDYGLNMLFVGNSILGNDPDPSIGWYGEGWGMAASSEDKDYAHQTVTKLANRYSAPVWAKLSDATSLESLTDTSTDEVIQAAVNEYVTAVGTAGANIINFQIGEDGSRSEATWNKILTTLTNSLKNTYPNLIINLCAAFWGEDTGYDYTVKKAIADTSAEDNIYFTATNLGKGYLLAADSDKTIEKYPYTAVNKYAGEVGAHPGDAGMERMADLIVETLSPAIAKLPTTFVAYPETMSFAEGLAITTAGGTLALVPTVEPTTASTKAIWTVSDENLATVSEDGVLTAINDGTVEVTATSKYNGTVTATATVAISGQTPKYTLTYAANEIDATNLPAADAYAKGTYTLEKFKTPLRAGYKFDGWALEDGTKVETVTVTADTTVYATWVEATAWEFDDSFDGFTVLNGSDPDLTYGTLMTVATDMTEDAPLTVVSPAIAIDPTTYNTLNVEMTNSVIDANTEAKLIVTTESGDEFEFSSPVKVASAPATHTFALTDVDEKIVSFKLIPTNIDANININRIEFTWVEPPVLDGYYSEDLTGGRIYGDMIDDWRDVPNSNGFAVEVDAEVSHDGGTSIKMSANEDGKDHYWFNTYIDATKYTINPGDTLEFSGWIKRSDDFSIAYTSTPDTPADCTSSRVFLTVTYLDAAGAEKTHTESNYLTSSDTKEWQFVKHSITIPTAKVPEGSTITKIQCFIAMTNSAAIKLTGHMWFDQFQIKRANPYTKNILLDKDEANDSAYIAASTFETKAVTTEEAHSGSYSYKFAGSHTGNGLLLDPAYFFSNYKVGTADPTFKISAWVKIGPQTLANMTNKEMFAYFISYISNDYEEKSVANAGLFDAYVSNGPKIPIKNTTDWQYVEATVNLQDLVRNYSDKKDVEGNVIATGEELAAAFTDRLLLTTKTQFLLSHPDEKVSIADGEAVYVDQFAITLLPDAESSNMFETELVSLAGIESATGAPGVRAVFNDSLIADATFANATILVNGVACTDYTYEIHNDNATVDIYPTGVTKISTFEMKGLKSFWGYDIITGKEKDSVNGDRFIRNYVPTHYYEGTGDLTNGLCSGYGTKYETITEADGNSAFQINDGTGTPWFFKYRVPEDKLASMTDKIKVTLDVKTSEDAKFPDPLNLTGNGNGWDTWVDIGFVRFYAYAIVLDTDGKEHTIEVTSPSKTSGVYVVNNAITADNVWTTVDALLDMSDAKIMAAVNSQIARDAAAATPVNWTFQKLVGIEFGAAPHSAGGRNLQGTIWTDKVVIENVMPNDEHKNIFAGVYECDNVDMWTDNLPYENQAGKGTDVSVDTTVFHHGDSSVKLTGGSGNQGRDLLTVVKRGGTTNQGHKDAYRISFWFKSTNTAARDLTFLGTGYIKDAEGKQQGLGIESPRGIYVEDGNDGWQKITCIIKFDYDEAASKGGYILPEGNLSYNQLNFTIRANDHAIPGTDTFWFDQMECYQIPADDLYSGSKITNQDPVVANGAVTAVKVDFNSSYITLSDLQYATVEVDGEAKEVESVALSSNGRTATYTLKTPVTSINTFEVKGLTDMWGKVVTTTTEIETVEAPEEVIPPSASVEFGAMFVEEEGSTPEYTKLSKENIAKDKVSYTDVVGRVTLTNPTDAPVTYDVVIVKLSGGKADIIKVMEDGITAGAAVDGEATTVTKDVSFPNDLLTTDDVKVYVWESLETMVPVITGTLE